ncbi:MAG: FliM/FliN family flagellar motor switch protein [Deltaproteobacteria bacterium]|nr:FliM/FliN family flagellar motor switch protein [Deltaproteobacteria bacterium]
MIKRKGIQQADAPLRDYAAIERALGRILSALFQESCSLTYLSNSASFDPCADWLICRHESTCEFGIEIQTEGRKTARAEFFSRLVRLAQFFHDLAPGALSVVAGWSSVPKLQHTFEVRTEGGQVAAARIASANEDLLASFFAPMAQSSPASGKVSQKSSVQLVVQLDAVRREFEVRADIQLRASAATSCACARMSRIGENAQIFIEKEKSPMTAMPTDVAQITLSLGAIEMSLEDLLLLRPGMCIEFEAPEVFDGMIMVNGVPWLEAEVKLHERSLTVKVASTALSDPPAPQKEEETSVQNLRLVG